MKNIIAFFIVLFVSASSFAIDNRYHINSRVELDQKPGTLLEIGEVISSQSALYFGALLPSDSKSNFEDEISMNLMYISARLDYFYSGAYEQGFYNGVILTYSEATFSSEEIEELDLKVSGAGLGVQVGYLTKVKNFTLGASLKGITYNFGTAPEYTNQEGEDTALNLPHHQSLSGSIDLGYKF